MKFILLLLLLFSFNIFALNIADIIKYSNEAKESSEIIEIIRKNDVISIKPEDIINLKNANVSTDVINELKSRYLESQKEKRDKNKVSPIQETKEIKKTDIPEKKEITSTNTEKVKNTQSEKNNIKDNQSNNTTNKENTNNTNISNPKKNDIGIIYIFLIPLTSLISLFILLYFFVYTRFSNFKVLTIVFIAISTITQPTALIIYPIFEKILDKDSFLTIINIFFFPLFGPVIMAALMTYIFFLYLRRKRCPECFSMTGRKTGQQEIGSRDYLKSEGGGLWYDGGGKKVRIHERTIEVGIKCINCGYHWSYIKKIRRRIR